MTKVSVLGIGALAVTVVPLLLAGCGTVGAAREPPVAPGVSASLVPARWVTYGPAGVRLVSVSVGGCGRVLAVAVRVPAGGDGCNVLSPQGCRDSARRGSKPREAALARRVACRGSPAP